MRLIFMDFRLLTVDVMLYMLGLIPSSASGLELSIEATKLSGLRSLLKGGRMERSESDME